MTVRIGEYPSTEKFAVVDTIPVPHPYCITPKHLEGGRMYLDRDALREAEQRFGAKCDICRKLVRKGKQGRVLSIDEHETALLIEVNDSGELNEVDGLHAYLLSIKEKAEQDGMAGFAFKQV